MKISYYYEKGKILFSPFFVLKSIKKNLITIYFYHYIITSCRNDTSQEKNDFYLEYRDSYNRKVTLDSNPTKHLPLPCYHRNDFSAVHSEEKLVGISDFFAITAGNCQD